MKKNESHFLLLIKYAPLAAIVVFYTLAAFFLYWNNFTFYKQYENEFIFFGISTVVLAFIFSFFVTQYLKKVILSYKMQLRKESALNRKNDFILFQQSKLATVGELLSNIAHQWRQPLSVITTAATGIKLQKELGQCDVSLEKQSIESIIVNANYLSQTIDDFRNFYNPNVAKKYFSVTKAVQDSLKIVGSQLCNHNIKILQDIHEFDIYGIENELMQVIINLINNAREQFQNEHNKNLKEKIIQLQTHCDEVYNTLYVWDNAQGIKKEHIQKVFEPYFTTKHQTRGTGIGLYMSEQIISKHFQGTITVENKKFQYQSKTHMGACFMITFPHASK
ncbi:sensor histidine kinase [Candidatus Marinarcus aquaticus]|uniref:histidine kinase n=1 Tax=Candidatus Marinarcus aquaticus TaxID=2044504 RepID=A0A4V1LP28_9BACT|nr:HAMP domain-containing sensor histidine kinase [Candidatus Marinarcus aquaticus]RXJ58070.1 hypothetical protein CRV04_06060 [Candidatus Marinarcus aquaticus]